MILSKDTRQTNTEGRNNRSLQQGWPSVDNVAVQTLDMLNLPAAASSGDFFHMRTQADSSGNKATVAGFAAPAHTQVEWKGISFNEIRKLHTKSKLLCCHFNSQGELLDAAGQNMKVHIWELGNYNVNTVEGHTHHNCEDMGCSKAKKSYPRHCRACWAGDDNRFSSNKGGSPQFLDSNDEIRLWDVNRGDCKLILKGGSRQVRFQPQLGDLLASSTEKNINIFDVKTNSIQKKLQGHIKDVRSIC
ncbi:hypothetical protein K7X08_027245 [Anisodus acutangulus]|uniref:Uncharacterized protein n=1 Tax=Anisodus acutangulus TaxID=402998 RepID=A0A9Q1MIK8_9SOLA|nr:hypothetical protein K7X08_027245 [Anisodus acutangulus]